MKDSSIFTESQFKVKFKKGIYLMNLMNERDAKLINFCRGYPKTIKQISEHLGIAIKNVLAKVRKLEELGIVEIKKYPGTRGILVWTKQNKEIDTELNRLIKIIKDNGGQITFEELHNKAYEGIPPFSSRGFLVNRAMTELIFSKFIERIYKLK